jgi:hypothetical protein
VALFSLKLVAPPDHVAPVALDFQLENEYVVVFVAVCEVFVVEPPFALNVTV